MTPEKTKLLVFCPDKQDAYSEYYKACNYIEIFHFHPENNLDKLGLNWAKLRTKLAC